MARRPKEHDRKPTVVTSGPQAGKARAGSTVNKGVHYEDAPKQQGPSKSSLLGLGETVPPEANMFMPEHLRVLPENPAELFEPLDIRVRCGEHEHVVRWTPQGVEVPHHDVVAEAVVSTLGGGKSPCMIVKEAFENEPNFASPVSSHSFLFAERDLLDVISVENSTPEEIRETLEQIMFRRGKTGASAYVMGEALEAWTTLQGASPTTGNRRMIVVTNNDFFQQQMGKSFNEMSYIAWRRISGMSEGTEIGDAMFAYSMWSDTSSTRMGARISSSWYDKAREKGLTVNGNLYLGSHEGEDIVLVAPQGKGEAFPSYASNAEQMAAEAQGFKAWFEETKNNHTSDGNEPVTYVGYNNVWGYDGNGYYPTDGKTLASMHESATDAASWATFQCVKDMFLDPSLTVFEFGEELRATIGDEFFENGDAPDLHDLMRECAEKGIIPRLAALKSAGWQVVPLAEN